MNTALWFLPCLFVVEIIFYFVRNKYFLLVFAVLGYLVTFLPFRLPWSFDVALVGVVIYGIGYFYKDTRVPNAALPPLFILNLVFGFLNGPVDMNNLTYGNMFFFYVAACSGMLFYAAVCKLTKKNKVTEYIASNTIALIGLVRVTWFIMNGVSYILFGTKIEYTNLGFSFIFSILQIGLTIPVIYCINRWLPFILGRPLRQTLNKNYVEVTSE